MHQAHRDFQRSPYARRLPNWFWRCIWASSLAVSLCAHPCRFLEVVRGEEKDEKDEKNEQSRLLSKKRLEIMQSAVDAFSITSREIENKSSARGREKAPVAV